MVLIQEQPEGIMPSHTVSAFKVRTRMREAISMTCKMITFKLSYSHSHLIFTELTLCRTTSRTFPDNMIVSCSPAKINI